MALSAFVLDTTTTEFLQAVIDQSRSVPVLVDFWATWCAPCRALGPILEKLATEYAGGFVLAKVDTDKEQALAAEYQIRSIPTVMLFGDGKMVASFQGALPEGKIRQFLAEHGVALRGATVSRAENPAERVAQLRAAVRAEGPRDALQLELAIALLANDELGEAGILLEALPPNVYQDAPAVRARARLVLRRLVISAPPRELLTERIAADADDTESRLQLGIRDLLDGETASGFEHLLTVLREQREDEQSPAKVALLEAFHMVDDDTLVRDARRRMAAMLF